MCCSTTDSVLLSGMFTQTNFIKGRDRMEKNRSVNKLHQNSLQYNLKIRDEQRSKIVYIILSEK